MLKAEYSALESHREKRSKPRPSFTHTLLAVTSKDWLGSCHGWSSEYFPQTGQPSSQGSRVQEAGCLQDNLQPEMPFHPTESVYPNPS